MTTLDSTNVQAVGDFQRTVWNYYRLHRRDMPWRTMPTPYYVLVSEIMLQQTQVARVRSKSLQFVRKFPSIAALADAPLSSVLDVWSGLGYNRRAKYLWQCAQFVQQNYSGQLPRDHKVLVALPGIGVNTAGAILAYAFNEPVAFIETNIRAVYVHHFFANNSQPVTDAAIRSLVAATLPVENPRDWYWALMDYGSHLKSTHSPLSTKIASYRPQSAFKGSRRQVRGQVVKLLLTHKQLSRSHLARLIADDRLPQVCDALVKEGLVTDDGAMLRCGD